MRLGFVAYAPRNDENEPFRVIASERFDFAHRPEFIEGAKQSQFHRYRKLAKVLF